VNPILLLQYVQLAEELIAAGSSLGSKMKILAHENDITPAEWENARAENKKSLGAAIKDRGGNWPPKAVDPAPAPSPTPNPSPAIGTEYGRMLGKPVPTDDYLKTKGYKSKDVIMENKGFNLYGVFDPITAAGNIAGGLEVVREIG
jgi:hypothetical protein